MGRRKDIDWESIEREYRVDQLSVAEIGRQYGVSHTAINRKAKKKGWTRQYAKRVRELVKERLILDASRDNAKATETIETAAERGVEVIRLHRKDIAALRNIESELLAELSGEPTKLYITQHKGVIVEKEVGIALTERASTLNALVGTMYKRIQLERQAFNLDADDPPELPMTQEQRLARIAELQRKLNEDGRWPDVRGIGSD